MNTETINIDADASSPCGDVVGKIDAIRTDESGRTMVRISDHWFLAGDVSCGKLA